MNLQEEETPKCNSCGQSMFLIDAIGRHTQMGEFDEKGMWRQTGMREMALYQCSKCKDVKID